MAHFRYQALTAQQQIVAGELHAESVAQAIAQLEAQGLNVQSIGYFTAGEAPAASRRAAGPAAGPALDPVAGEPQQPAVAAEQAALVAHMANVLERGRAIVPALAAYAEEMTSKPIRPRLQSMLRILERGDAFEASAALKSFPSGWIPLLGAATANSDPGRVLREFLEESRRANELRRQWWQTIAYPLLVGGIAAAVMVALSIFVIPIFRDIFSGFGLKLPGFTQFIFSVASWITSGRVVVALAVIAAALGLLRAGARLLPAWMRDGFDDRFGTLLGRSTASARFSQFLADLIDAGLDTPGALRIAGFATASPRMRRAAWRLAVDVEAQRPITPHAYRPFLTASILHALNAEMATQSRVRLLGEISACHAERARQRLSWTRGTIEPIAICLVALVVGATVVGLFLPLVSLVQGLS